MTIHGCDIAALRQEADVAIIGAGPVGIRLALALADSGLDVVLLESGLAARSAAAQALSAADIADAGRHAAMDLAVQRGFGGTSAL